MSNIIYNGHVQCLILNTPGQTPTVPSPSTLIPTEAGWNDATDIMIGEFALNAEDGIVYTRDRSGIIPIVGGGGTGVQFVDGDEPGIVDNTDPANPIISLLKAYTYTDTAISAEVINRNNAIASSAASTLASANAYTDSAISTLKGGVPAGGDTLNKLYNLIVGQGQFVGGHDASGGQLPTTGSGAGGAIDKGDFWRISVAGTIPGIGVLRAGDVLYASIANASVAADFFAVENNQDQATSTTLGLVKLYTITGNATDGTMDQNSISAALSGKQDTITGAASTITTSNLTANRILISNASGKVDVNSALTAGSILFSNGVSLAQDNGVLFYDTGNRILYLGNNAGAFAMTRMHIESTIDGFTQVNYINKSSGTSASTDFVASADNATQTTNYIDFGINGSGNTSSDVLGGALTGYLYNNGGKLVMGTQSAFDHIFFTNSTERYRTTAFGWTGFNTTQKFAQVTVTKVADFVATGTTNANTTGSITGIGTRFLSEISVGDLISLSSAPATFFVVTSIISDTLLGVTNSLGNGTSQTINVKKSPFSVLSNTGTNLFTISGIGSIGINQVPISSTAFSVTSTATSISAISGTASGGTAVTGSGSVGGNFTGTGNGATLNTTSATTLVFGAFVRKTHNTNSNDGVLGVSKQVTSGNGAIGISSMAYFQMSDDSSLLAFGKFGMVATNVTSSGSLQQADWTFSTLASGTGTMTERVRITSPGQFLIGTSTANTNPTQGRLRIAQGTAIIDIGEFSAGIGCIWMNGVSGDPSGTNYILAQAASITAINTSIATNTIVFRFASTDRYTFRQDRVSFNPTALGSGANTSYNFVTPNNTGQTAATETIGFDFNMSGAIQHASNTGYALQRDAIYRARTHTFASSGGVITRGVSISLTGAPITGTNSNITTTIGLEIEAGSVVGAGGTPTTAYAALFNAPSGATTNWALGIVGNSQFQNKVFIGAAAIAPTAYLTIAAGVTANAQVNLLPGVAPTSPVDGDIYYVDTNDRLMFRKGALDVEFLSASAVTTEALVSDRSLTITYNGTTYKLLAKS